MSIYDTGNMLAAVDIIQKPKTFLKKRYFNTVEQSLGKKIAFDVRKGSRRIAPFVSPKIAGKLMPNAGFVTHEFEAPYIKSKSETTAGEMLNRSFGENVWGSKTPLERASDRLTKELIDRNAEIERTEELMCAKLIHSGKVVAKGEGIELEVDFKRDPDNYIVLTGTHLWSAPTTASPLTDLLTGKQLGLSKSSIAPTDCIFGKNVISKFLKCDEIIGSNTKKSIFDIKSIENGTIKPEELGEGVMSYGKILECNLNIFTYDEVYLDEDSGEEIPVLDPDCIYFGSPMAENVMGYAAIQDMKAIEANMFAVQRYPRTWIPEESSSVRYLELQSAPLPITKRVDSWVVMKVL